MPDLTETDNIPHQMAEEGSGPTTAYRCLTCGDNGYVLGGVGNSFDEQAEDPCPDCGPTTTITHAPHCHATIPTADRPSGGCICGALPAGGPPGVPTSPPSPGVPPEGR